MLHLIPAPLHIAGLRVAHAVRLRWWRIVRPRVRGCRVLVLDAEERVLLIRHSYGSGEWMLPGGGLARREEPITGALRELGEETGCTLDPALPFGRIDEPASFYETHLVVGWTSDAPRADRREILEAAFFALEALPDRTARRLAARLPDWVTAAKAARPPR